MRALTSILVVLALAFVVAACGDSDDATTASNKDTASGASYVDWPLFGRIP